MSRQSRGLYDALPADANPTRLARNANFRLLWFGQLLSDTGGSASMLAYPLVVLAVTRSAAIAGAVATAASIVMRGARLPAGTIADRFDRRRILLLTDALRAVAVASLGLALAFGQAAWPVIMLVASVDALGIAMFGAASFALIPMLVAQEQIGKAWAATQARSQAASMGGPPLGGLLFTAGRQLPFLFDTVTYLVSLFTVFGIRGNFRASTTSERMSLGRGMATGFSYVRQTPLLRAFILQAPLMNFAYAATLFAVPVGLRVAGEGAGVIGGVLAAMAAGALIGAVCAPWIERHLDLPWILVGINLITCGLLLVAAVAAPSPLVALPLFFIGFLNPAASTALFVRISHAVPTTMFGRVTSTLQFSGQLLAVAAPVMTGALIASVHTNTTFVVIAAIQMLAILVTVRKWNAWKVPGSPHPRAGPTGS